MHRTDNHVGTVTVRCVGRYAFRPVSTTETVPEASSEDEITEKILLGQYDECYAIQMCFTYCMYYIIPVSKLCEGYQGRTVQWGDMPSVKLEHIMGTLGLFGPHKALARPGSPALPII